MKDKVTVTITMERNANGTAKVAHKIEGEGFFHFEILGLIEIAKSCIIKASIKSGKDAPDDKKIRNVYEVDETETQK
jgi:hypothetical protein